MLKKGTLFFLLCLLLTQGCGYHLKGFGDTLPEEIRTIAIGTFENDTFEADMGILLESALAEEFSRSRRLKVVPESRADVLLEGKILSFANRPVSFSAADQVQDYRVEVKVDVTLRARQGEKVFWRGRGLTEVKDYSVEPGKEDLAETSESRAKEEVARELAELIVDRVFEGF